MVRASQYNTGQVHRVVAFAILAMMTLGLRDAAAHKRESPVTWNGDVQPIVAARCASCHSPGGIGGFPLLTYQDARTWAKRIREELLAGRMPPWPAARGFGDFSNDRSLTPTELELLTAWTDGGMKLGPAPAALAAGGKPDSRSDLLIQMDAARPVVDRVARYTLHAATSVDRWIIGWEFRPGNSALIEQAIVSVDDTRLGAWTPSDPPVRYPAGIAQRLRKASAITLEIHYRKSAKPEVDRSGVAFFFGSRPRSEVHHQVLPCSATTIPDAVHLLAITPMVGASGESMEAVARGGSGHVEPLIVIRRYETAYPLTYRYRKPVRIPPQTVIELTSSSAACSAELEFVNVAEEH